MSTLLSSLPRTIPFGNSTLLAAGLGRVSGSFIYLDTSAGKTRELHSARVVYAGHHLSTVVFEDTPSIAPAIITGDAAKLGLVLNQKLLVEPKFQEGSTAVLHWFPVKPKAAKAPKPVPAQPKRMAKPVKVAREIKKVGVVTFVAGDFAWGKVEDSAGVQYIADAREVSGALRLNARVHFSPSYDHRGKIAREVTVDRTAGRIAA